MEHAAKEVIGSLEYSELCRLRDDLKAGGIKLRKWINEGIKAFEHEHRETCSVCDSAIEPTSISTATLIFGPHDFRKKASFCATDCLEYFLRQVKRGKGTQSTVPEQEQHTKQSTRESG